MLTGRVVIVVRADTDEGARVATELAAAGAGASVVLVGEDATRLGLLAAEMSEVQSVQVAIYVGDAASPTLAEMLTDLFPTS